MTGKVPPNSLRAEQSVLGCAMSGEQALYRITAVLQPDDFYQPAHQMIFTAVLDLAAEARPVDILTVSDRLESRGQLERVGGLAYVSTLPDLAPVVANAAEYADLVRQKSMLRRLIAVLSEVSGLCYGEQEQADLLIDLAGKRVYEIRENQDRSGFSPIRQILDRTFNEIANPASRLIRNVPSGYVSLDRVLGGLRPGGLYILACRPSMGKSALAHNIALRTATLYKTPTAMFSLEMSKEEIANRLISCQTLVSAKSIGNRELRPEDLTQMTERILPLSLAPIFIDDRGGTSVIEIFSQCQQLRFEHRLGLIIIDYLQLMRGRTTENRQQEVSEISRSLKIMAKDLNVPVLALSQLSRSCEQRQDKRPMLSDLRDSGSIEQDADVVMFLYRDRYYQTDQPPTETEIAEIIIAKNRQGETGTVELGFFPRYTMFFEPDEPDEVQPQPAFNQRAAAAGAVR